VLALVLLGIAVLCALISRALLITAALRISVWWTLGVLCPFGPMFFRLSYPDEARRSMIFRYATLICVAGYFVSGGFSPSLAYYKRRVPRQQPPKQTEPSGYAIEKVPAKVMPTPKPTPTLDERRAANAKEFEQLRKWAESLRIRKRDLLHSDVEGNREYVVDLALYNQALTKATEDRNALSGATAK
jgi:hypothetical protein